MVNVTDSEGNIIKKGITNSGNIFTSRAYESNIDTLNAQKNMISKALEIGK